MKTGHFRDSLRQRSTSVFIEAMRLTCVHGATEEADSLIIIHINVAFEARRFKVGFNLDPVEEPAVSTVDTYVNCGDTSHAAASTRHAEDVQAVNKA